MSDQCPGLLAEGDLLAGLSHGCRLQRWNLPGPLSPPPPPPSPSPRVHSRVTEPSSPAAPSGRQDSRSGRFWSREEEKKSKVGKSNFIFKKVIYISLHKLLFKSNLQAKKIGTDLHQLQEKFECHSTSVASGCSHHRHEQRQRCHRALDVHGWRHWRALLRSQMEVARL